MKFLYTRKIECFVDLYEETYKNDGYKNNEIRYNLECIFHELTISFILEKEGCNVGFLIANQYFCGDPDDPIYIYLDEICILPNYKNQGYGSLMIHELLKIAAEKKIGVVCLDTYVNSSEFYSKNGFKTSEDRMNMYFDVSKFLE